MQDDRTTNLSLPKPSAGNILTDDVARMRSALDLIDAAIASKASAADISAQLANLIGSAPAALDTLAELATALNNDPSFAAHTATSIASLQSAVATLQAGMSTYYTRQKWNLTAGQTSINTSGYMVGFVELFLNGVLLVDGDDYTATDGTHITLTVGGAAGDSVEAIMLHPFQLVNTTFTGKTTIEGQLDMPQWTTATRPASPRIGTAGYNTTIGALENYTASGWAKVSTPIPIISNVSGGIYSGSASNLTLTGANFGSAAATISFKSGAVTATATATPTNSGQTCVVAVPSSIYGLPSGSTVSFNLTNGDGVTSPGVIITSTGFPTGGTVTTSGNYRIHTFTSSGTLTIPLGFPASADYLVVAGGGGAAQDYGGGGGAGGLLSGSINLASGTQYSVTIGGGGSQAFSGVAPTVGNNSSIASLITAVGGGGGRNDSYTPYPNQNGGSGGGGNSTYGTGTSGQGNNGASSGLSTSGGGGGGAGGSGNANRNGGVGLASSISGASVYYAGGGAGSNSTGSGTGGLGGGGGSGSLPGTANTGGGGASQGGGWGICGPGGSGVVIIRFSI